MLNSKLFIIWLLKTKEATNSKSSLNEQFSGIKNEPLEQHIDDSKSASAVEKSGDPTEASGKLADVKDSTLADVDTTLRDEATHHHHHHHDEDLPNTSTTSTFVDDATNLENADGHAVEDDDTLNDEEYSHFDEFDLRRLRHLGLFKAYLEFYNQLPELFKAGTQFQVIPLATCVDLQQNATSLYTQSIVHSQSQNYQHNCASSSYSNIYSSGYGTSWSDLDMDFKVRHFLNVYFSALPYIHFYLKTI